MRTPQIESILNSREGDGKGHLYQIRNDIVELYKDGKPTQVIADHMRKTWENCSDITCADVSRIAIGAGCPRRIHRGRFAKPAPEVPTSTNRIDAAALAIHQQSESKLIRRFVAQHGGIDEFLTKLKRIRW
jgi:hypothetical protein